MNLADVFPFLVRHWRDPLEIAILAISIYYGWLFFRGTRGARVLTGLAVLILAIMLVSQSFELRVIGWLFRNLSAFLVFALVVIFQPELRRALAALGSQRLFTFGQGSRLTVEVLAELAFGLANKQLGALIAIERDSSLEQFVETGVTLDAQLSDELVHTIFHPKTPLHDGGVIIRNDRIVAAACIFPLSQRGDLNRDMGLRHRAALGLTEEFDAVVVVVSEETGIVSISHRGGIERNLDQPTLQARLAELLLSDNQPADEEAADPPSVREDHVPRARNHAVGSHKKEHRDDRLAF